MPLRYDIFLSYSRADSELVAPLRDELRRRGYRVFFDTQSIDPGSKWKDRLEEAIRSSRTLVLCWSERTRASEYITFEYSHARALHKPVFPWLLDMTPLPALMEVQGIPDADPIIVADRLTRSLGVKLAVRRRLQGAVVVLLVAALGLLFWYTHRPLPPWQLTGTVTDFGHNPLDAVGVDVTSTEGKLLGTASTDEQGHYALTVPQPEPASVLVTFHKQGYQGDRLTIRTDKAFEEQLAKAN
jgi:hypothetical protein